MVGSALPRAGPKCTANLAGIGSPEQPGPSPRCCPTRSHSSSTRWQQQQQLSARQQRHSLSAGAAGGPWSVRDDRSQRSCSRHAARLQATASVAEFPDVASDRGLSQDQRRPASVQEKVGVLLLNLGGPETLDDVQPFLYNLFADPDIIRLPKAAQFLQPFIATVISTLRAPKSAEGYKAIGGGSPLRRITEEQGQALAQALRRKGQEASVYVAMRYWMPFTEDAIEQVKRDGVNKLVILPLYPQFSISTSGSSLRLLEAIFKSDPALQGLPHTVIPSWYQRRGYIVAQADLIEAELARFDGSPDDVEIFFSAHGVPESYVEQAGDPYKEEMEQCIGFIMAELRQRGIENSYTLAYQSRVGPVEWLKPYTDETIRRLGAQGCRSMLAVPISFVSEHIETLEEMDMEYRELALESGIQRWRRLPALNTNRTFIDDLADAVLEALPFAGSMAGSNPSDSLVPLGDVEALLETYDRERRVLPPPVLIWKWGWTKSAETWNGRIAMLAIVVVLVLEVVTGQGVLSRLPFT